ncbi:hypothetical protein [Martelella alba]|uniref:hypothetical protein n=1 Tax=Martelella alba TaxID=2590451 RepID=UPI0014853A73|nr:hypothetical protein [Martelella alba]
MPTRKPPANSAPGPATQPLAGGVLRRKPTPGQACLIIGFGRLEPFDGHER